MNGVFNTFWSQIRFHAADRSMWPFPIAVSKMRSSNGCAKSKAPMICLALQNLQSRAWSSNTL